MQRAKAPGTSISQARSIGTHVQPISRAASARKSGAKMRHDREENRSDVVEVDFVATRYLNQKPLRGVRDGGGIVAFGRDRAANAAEKHGLGNQSCRPVIVERLAKP